MGSNNLSDFTGEILTPEEFADRMHVCRTIIYEMMADNRLQAGRHYILLNSKKRFPWGGDLIRKLLEDSIDFCKNKNALKVRNNLKRNKKNMTDLTSEKAMKSKNLPYINLD